GANELRHLVAVVELLRLGHVTDGLSLEARLRKVEVVDLERRMVADGLLLVRAHAYGDGNTSEVEVEAATPLGAERLLDRSVGVLPRLGVVVAPVRRHERRTALQIELAHEVALTEVEVDSTFVDGRVRTLVLDDSEN